MGDRHVDSKKNFCSVVDGPENLRKSQKLMTLHLEKIKQLKHEQIKKKVYYLLGWDEFLTFQLQSKAGLEVLLLRACWCGGTNTSAVQGETPEVLWNPSVKPGGVCISPWAQHTTGTGAVGPASTEAMFR